MSYSTLIQRLFNLNLYGGIKLGLQNILQLQEQLGFPDRSFDSIHIAGTNGKGSVTTKIASAFQHAGYRVGLYTSPHLTCFRERIRINGEMISEQAVEALLSRLFNLLAETQIPATFFEVTTLLAFLYFAQEGVDVAVLETGLGGRLDATNIVTPRLSVITSISLDHTEILGKTREEITREKGGIIKPGIPVVIGPHVPLSVIQEIAERQHSPCIQVKKTPPLFEEENREIARTALEQLASVYSLSAQAIEQGLTSGQPCRFEIVKHNPCILLDVAHNPDGLKHLFESIKIHYPSKSLRLLFGLSKNKDLEGCLKIICSHTSDFHLVEAPNGRGASIAQLAALIQSTARSPFRLFLHESIAASTHFACEEAARHEQLLVICGSFFIMGSVRQALGFTEPLDTIDLNERYQEKIV